MGSLGMPEIIAIFVVALIVFGPRKLPEIGKTIGKGLAEFKKASNELKQTWEEEVGLEKEKAALKSIVSENPLNPSKIIDDISKTLSSEAVPAAAPANSEKAESTSETNTETKDETTK